MCLGKGKPFCGVSNEALESKKSILKSYIASRKHVSDKKKLKYRRSEIKLLSLGFVPYFVFVRPVQLFDLLFQLKIQVV